MISERDLYLGVKTIFAVESIEIPNSIFVFSLNISIFRIAATCLSRDYRLHFEYFEPDTKVEILSSR
jgi:hypothetical protein